MIIPAVALFVVAESLQYIWSISEQDLDEKRVGNVILGF